MKLNKCNPRRVKAGDLEINLSFNLISDREKLIQLIHLDQPGTMKRHILIFFIIIEKFNVINALTCNHAFHQGKYHLQVIFPVCQSTIRCF